MVRSQVMEATRDEGRTEGRTEGRSKVLTSLRNGFKSICLISSG